MGILMASYLGRSNSFGQELALFLELHSWMFVMKNREINESRECCYGNLELQNHRTYLQDVMQLDR